MMEDTQTGRVFVTQETSHNLAKATRFGRLVPLLPATRRIVMTAGPVINELRSKLKDFSDIDFLLPLGDPVAIGLAACVAAGANSGKIAWLKFDREMNDYLVVKTDLYADTRKDPEP